MSCRFRFVSKTMLFNMHDVVYGAREYFNFNSIFKKMRIKFSLAQFILKLKKFSDLFHKNEQLKLK